MASEISAVDRALGFFERMDKAAHGIPVAFKPKSDEAIVKVFDGGQLGHKAMTALDAIPGYFSAKEGETATTAVRNRLADPNHKYGWGDAARFGMQTYAAASVAGRVATGGGLYKDGKGNFNIVGIPFI